MPFLAGLFYGALHLLAWNAPFPSGTEKLLRNISGVSIVSFTVVARYARFLYYCLFDSQDVLVHNPARQLQDAWDNEFGWIIDP